MNVPWLTGLLIAGLCAAVPPAIGALLVENGQPVAEIVVDADAGPSIQLAAIELQNHLEKISGARLPIVQAPTTNVTTRVFVGESDHTRKRGITLEGVRHDGFRITATDSEVILIGHEFSIARINEQFSDRNPRIRRERWKELSGRDWGFPGIADNRGRRHDVYMDDGTGTLYAVYELLEQLGMRWYLPMEDMGIVYPSLPTVRIPPLDLKREPHFAVRQINNGVGRFEDEWRWFKFMKLGTTHVFPQHHTVGYLMQDRENMPEAAFGRTGGQINRRIPRLTSPELRQDTAAFLETMLKAFPGLPYLPINMKDGFVQIDDEDNKTWRGDVPWGEFTEYTWDFVLDVRKKLKANHPDMKFTTYAYSTHKLPPSSRTQIPDDVYISFCQNSTLWMLPDIRRDLEVRREWLERIGPGRMMLYDYYFQHAPPRKFPPIPVIFTRYMEENFRGIYEWDPVGFWVDTSWHTGDEYKWARSVLRRPGISHLMVYLHNRFAWNDKVDLQAELEEYYDLFFGPARAEMKAFYEFSELVWSRPIPRRMMGEDGFVGPDDVDRYFDILGRARMKAGDSIYGRRIDLIVSEMEPLKDLFTHVGRLGPIVRSWRRYYLRPPVIDGDLTKEFWTERGATFEQQGSGIFFPLRDMYTGTVPDHVGTSVSFRDMSDGSAIIIGIECLEPRMDRLKADCTQADDRAILDDDHIEIRIETAQGMRPVIAVNSLGVVHDTMVTDNVADLPTFYSVGDVAVRRLEDRWTVEVKVDTAPLGGAAPTQYMPWGVTIARKRMAGNTPEFYMLSPSGTDFEDSSSMANLMAR